VPLSIAHANKISVSGALPVRSSVFDGGFGGIAPAAGTLRTIGDIEVRPSISSKDAAMTVDTRGIRASPANIATVIAVERGLPDASSPRLVDPFSDTDGGSSRARVTVTWSAAISGTTDP